MKQDRATEDRKRAFKGVSPGLLPPLGIIFGLLVAFIAAQVWGNQDRADTAVNHEASALRAVVLLSRAFPDDAQTRIRVLVDRHIQEAQDVEWPAMARQRATLTMIPDALRQALELAIRLPVTGEGLTSHDRPFTGQFAVRPTPLLQVRPQSPVAEKGS